MLPSKRRPADAPPVPATILVTGATLVPEAAALLEAHALALHYLPSYSDSGSMVRSAGELQTAAIIHGSGQLTAEVIDASDRLRVIVKHGSGVDNIDLVAASERGIPVLRTLGANADAVAAHTMALVVALLKDLFPLDRAVKGGAWPKSGYRGRDLAGTVLGLVGFGAIGQRVATLARGLGMHVLVFDPQVPLETNDTGLTRAEDLGHLLAAANVVSLHCPLTPATRHLIGAEQLRQMQPTAFLVNTARGGLVDEAALLEALRGGGIAGAGLDTFETEPPVADHPLWELPNLIATPHVAGASIGAVHNMGMQAARHVIDVLRGPGPDLRSVANPDFREHWQSPSAAIAGQPNS